MGSVLQNVWLGMRFGLFFFLSRGSDYCTAVVRVLTAYTPAVVIWFDTV